MKIFKRLGLGTVQWGMAYGIANQVGQPSSSTILEMLHRTREVGISCLDTAYTYGNAENVIGSFHFEVLGFQIITKTKHIHGAVDEASINAVVEAFHESLTRLARAKVYGLLIQRAEVLLCDGGKSLWKALEKLKADGKVQKIGVSVYSPRQLLDILIHYPVDIVQLPFNIYDQRFKQCGLFDLMKKNGVEIHARSLFLQGLLLMPPDSLPNYFNGLRAIHSELHQEFDVKGMSSLEGCLSYGLDDPHIDKLILGCETLAQLNGILEAARNISVKKLSISGEYAITEERFINPSHWPHG